MDSSIFYLVLWNGRPPRKPRKEGGKKKISYLYILEYFTDLAMFSQFKVSNFHFSYSPLSITKETVRCSPPQWVDRPKRSAYRGGPAVLKWQTVGETFVGCFFPQVLLGIESLGFAKGRDAMRFYCDELGWWRGQKRVVRVVELAGVRVQWCWVSWGWCGRWSWLGRFQLYTGECCGVEWGVVVWVMGGGVKGAREVPRSTVETWRGFSCHFIARLNE